MALSWWLGVSGSWALPVLLATAGLRGSGLLGSPGSGLASAPPGRCPSRNGGLPAAVLWHWSGEPPSAVCALPVPGMRLVSEPGGFSVGVFIPFGSRWPGCGPALGLAATCALPGGGCRHEDQHQGWGQHRCGNSISQRGHPGAGPPALGVVTQSLRKPPQPVRAPETSWGRDRLQPEWGSGRPGSAPAPRGPESAGDPTRGPVGKGTHCGNWGSERGSPACSMRDGRGSQGGGGALLP